jgi:Flp pilus assembly protein TadD/GTP-binding protein EngB required for normal cell division
LGILDRIAGTLDELAGDGDAEAREELTLVAAQVERGDLADAEARARDVAARFPRLPAAHLGLGRVLVAAGRLEDAVTAFGRAVDLDGDNALAWTMLGEALSRLGRGEPAREALRKALALAFEPALRGRAHAALGRVCLEAGQTGKAVRELAKAVELSGDDAEVALLYGRALARDGEAEGAEWLTRAARRPGAPPTLFAEAAAATRDPAIAEKLLREGHAAEAAGAKGSLAVGAALARHLARVGRADEALTLALAGVAANPQAPDALAALREAYAGAARWAEALAVARREAELGAAPPPATRLALALAARDLAALAALAQETTAELPLTPLRAFLSGRATDDELLALARLAPDAATRRFVAAARAPAPPPARDVLGLLAWAHELAARTPALAELTIAAGRAVEAFDRPLLVAVMGEFNAGKSSFVNALVGEEVAPTGVTPTTATINVWRHGAAPGARVVYHDGTTRELGAASVGPFLRELADAEAAAVRVVEIFHPLDALRRVEIVDTPGWNALSAAHEKVAREFLVDADALVWVFALGQAAKASEKEALELARGAGKRVVGVLNKVDAADADDVRAVERHVRASVGPLLEDVVPFSATRALKARRAGAADPALASLEAALERHFFGAARALKRETALAALRRFVAAATSATAASAAPDFAARRAAADALDARLRGALARERVALRARIDEAYRAAAFEVRDFVRPRAWLFGEHRAEAADERFLVELLEDAIERATTTTRDALLAAAADDGAASPDVARAVAEAVARFDSYARGAIEGGAVAEFFRVELPRLKLEPAAIRDALMRRAPDPAPIFFAPLARALEAAHEAAHAALDAEERDAEIRRLLREEHVDRPLAALAAAVDELAAPG